MSQVYGFSVQLQSLGTQNWGFSIAIEKDSILRVVNPSNVVWEEAFTLTVKNSLDATVITEIAASGTIFLDMADQPTDTYTFTIDKSDVVLTYSHTNGVPMFLDFVYLKKWYRLSAVGATNSPSNVVKA